MFRLVPRPSALISNPDEVNKIINKKLTQALNEQLDLNLNTVLHGTTKTMGSVLNGMQVTIEGVRDDVQEFSLYSTIEQTTASLLNTRYVQILDSAIAEVNLKHPEYRS